MSFSSNVKKELAVVENKARHCKIAQLSSFFSNNGKTLIEKDRIETVIDNREAEECFISMFGDFFRNIEPEIVTEKNSNYFLSIKGEKYVREVVSSLKLITENNSVISDAVIIHNSCCKRAFLRGAFLLSGSVTNPENSYHFEIVCQSREHAELISDSISFFGINAKIGERKDQIIVYIKDSEGIVDMLSVLGANVSLLEMENVRIKKEVRNDINRRVNFETSNIQKTVTAAMRQLEDINYLIETKHFNELSEREILVAKLRLDNPEVSISELGELANPKLTKSCINHRLRKISELANYYR